MSHIDEGALHAYLDGALDAYPASEASRIREHLEECEACAARLEDERAVRTQAESILASSAPVVQMPPLEDLRTLAEQRTASSASRGMSRVNRWGWAASVVLALGTGWMLRGTIPNVISPPPVREEAAEPSVAAPPTTSEPAVTQGMRQQPMGAGADNTPDALAEEVEALAPDARSDVDATPDAASPDAATDRNAAPNEAAADPEALAAAAADREASARQLDAEEVREMPTPPPPAAPASGAVSASTDPGVRAERREAPVVLDTARRDASLLRLDDSLTKQRAEPRPGEALTLRARAAREGEAEPLVWRVEQDPAVLEALADMPGPPAARRDGLMVSGNPAALLVPGLELVDVAYLEDAEIPDVIRVRQRAEEGDTIEIVHFPQGYDPTNLPDFPDDGLSELSRPSGSGWIVIRGREEGERLLGFLARITGG